MRKINKYYILFPSILVIFFIGLLLYQSCQSGGFKVTNYKSQDGDGSVPDPKESITPTPPQVPKLDAECLEKAVYDACVFLKDPVSQENKTFSSPLLLTSSNDSLQKYGVKIEEVDDSGHLSNEFIDVRTKGIHPRVDKAKTTWKIKMTDKRSNLLNLQVHIYYFLTLLRQIIKSTTDTFHFTKLIPVYAYDDQIKTNAYYDPSTGSISIGYGYLNDPTTDYSLAFDVDIIMHEYGHALLDQAMGDRGISDGNGNGQNCNTKKGCLMGIHEGQADFHVVLMFPEKPTLGCTWFNTTNGFRNPSKFVPSSAATTEVHSIGEVYSSIWYEVYKKSSFNKDILRIFVAHQAVITAADTFMTALEKIKTIDKNLFNSKYSQMFTDEYKSHEL